MRLGVLLVLASATAVAQPTPETPGGKLFEEGRELAKQGKYAEACDKFEKSYALDAGVGTELNLADCQEHLGHVAMAWRMFDEAAQRLAAEPVRQKFARDRADALVGKLGTAVVKLADPSVAGISVTIARRGVKPAAEISERVDPGTVDVAVTVPGKPTIEQTQSVAAGGTIIFDLSDTKPPPPVGTVAREQRRHSRVVASYAIAGVGAGVFLGGVILGFVAKSQYTDATKDCPVIGGKVTCDAAHFNDAQSAGTLADIGTVIGSVGLAAVVGGAVLFLTAPKDVVVTPMASGQTAGVAISGTF